MFDIPQKTKTDFLNEGLVKLNELSNETVRVEKENYLKGFSTVWDNPEFTAQEFFDHLGNQAYKVFENAYKVIAHIKDLDPTYEPPTAPHEFTLNEDGTVTVILPE